MSGRSGQVAELEDLFESSVNLEEHHFQQGHNEGLKEGVQLGKVEGRDVGLKSGFEAGEELGFYKGCIHIWNAAIEIDPKVFSTRVQKNLKQLEKLVEKYPLLEPENETLQDILGAMRTKFRAISAMLSAHLEYEGYPKSSQAIAHLGPGLDFLGAVEGFGDHVAVQVDGDVEPGEILISSINADNGRLGLIPKKNCAGIAAKGTMEMLGIRSVGVSLSLEKGLPLGSGPGSSAVNAISGGRLAKSDLILDGLESEAAISGYHADNVAPSSMGGLILVRSYSPLDLITLPFLSDKELFFVLVAIAFETLTREMRAVLPAGITMKDHILKCSQAAALMAAELRGDPSLLGAALSSDSIVEPNGGPVILGMLSVKAAAPEAGAFG